MNQASVWRCLAGVALSLFASGDLAHARPLPAAGPTATPEHGAADPGTGHGAIGASQARPPLRYRAHKGLEVRSGKTRVRSFFAVETNASYGHCGGDGCPPDDTSGLHVRRARAAFDTKMPHDLGIAFAIQIKNEIIVLKNAFLSWQPSERVQLAAGFLKPPGGLERDSSTWIKAFPERSVVANFKRDRIIGVRAFGWDPSHTWRFGGAFGRAPTGVFDAQEPEDQVMPPMGAEVEDLAKAVGNFESFGSVSFAPSKRLEIGVAAAVWHAEDLGLGPAGSEPYETHIVDQRFYQGFYLDASLDVAAHTDHTRIMAEGTAFRGGDTVPHDATEPTKNPVGFAGYLTFGWTPNGKYGPAIDNNPLRRGIEWITRFEVFRESPGQTSNAAAFFYSVTTGANWQLWKQLRMQADVAVQKYNSHVVPVNVDGTREYAEVWAQVRM